MVRWCNQAQLHELPARESKCGTAAAFATRDEATLRHHGTLRDVTVTVV